MVVTLIGGLDSGAAVAHVAGRSLAALGVPALATLLDLLPELVDLLHELGLLALARRVPDFEQPLLAGDHLRHLRSQKSLETADPFDLRELVPLRLTDFDDYSRQLAAC